ncbi:TonB-dependent receptor [uncultured Desulfobacterium sp.]|uniref:TonB-dependent receptor n=1 Tax=uncultured Desulfobacterium sp. TaxID=201089 RepID=A0A445N170_9BACT|nr:TonB-dependent receptor [uncultured Desulfobacterium sp.]
MNTRTFLISILAIFLCFIYIADICTAAGEPASEEGIYTLGEIVVQGKTEGVEATGVVHELTEDDIRNSDARNLVEAVDLLPGVDVFTGGDGTPRINIRGFRTRHVLLLLNGIPLNSAYDQQFDPSLIPVENIAEIKTTIGPSSVLYGQGALGGVINIITKKGTKETKGTIKGEVGEGGFYLGEANISSGAKGFDFFLSGSALKRDAFPLSNDFHATNQEDGGDRENSHKERNNLFTNIGYKVNDELNLGLNFSCLNGEYGIPGSIIADASDPFAPNPKYERIDHLEGYSAQIAGEYYPTNSFSLRSWVFINYMEENDNRYDSNNFNRNDLPLLDSWQSMYDQETNIKGVSVQPKYDLGERGTITLGFFTEKDRWESDGKVKDSLSGLPPQWIILYPQTDKDFNVYSLTVEYELNPIPKLGMVAGLGRHKQDRDERKDNDNSVLLAAHYDLTDSMRLKTAFQRNIRFPSLRQLYDDNGGNSELKTERVDHYTLGTELKLPWNTRLTIDGFESIAKNFIEKDNDISLFENFDKYEFRGAEIAAEISVIKNLMLRTSYSYLYTKDLSDSGKDELQNHPENRGTLECKYDFEFGLSPYVSVLYVADQYYYSKLPPIKKAELGSYTLVNVKLNQKVLNDRVNLIVGAENVFDQDYQQSYALPQAGRFIFGGMEMRF